MNCAHAAQLTLNLAGDVLPDLSRHDAADNNMMVVLQKASEGEWSSLEGNAAPLRGGCGLWVVVVDSGCERWKCGCGWWVVNVLGGECARW